MQHILRLISFSTLKSSIWRSSFLPILSLAILSGSACPLEPDCSQVENSCEQGGLQRCAANAVGVETCMTDTQGCLAWSPAVMCAAHELCDDTSEQTYCACEHECTAPGLTNCNDDQVQICLVDDFGCLFLSDYYDCADSGQTCAQQGDSASCEGTCHNSCATLGQQNCNGAVLQSCVEDSAGCHIWQAIQDCSVSNQNCEFEGDVAECVSSASCTGNCQIQGQNRCEGNKIQHCELANDSCLYWSDIQDCADNSRVCSMTDDVASCTDETTSCQNDCELSDPQRCTAETIEHCALDNAGCKKWTVLTNCADAHLSCEEVDQVGPTCLSSGQSLQLCQSCTTHSQCAAYTGDYGGSFCQPLAAGSSEYFCLQDCSNDASLCAEGDSCDASGNCVPAAACADTRCSSSNPYGDCAPGLRCSAGQCVNLSGDHPTGSACASAEDCDDDANCYPASIDDEQTGFLGGYCMQQDCSASAPCPPGASCISISTDSQVCLDQCLSSRDCRAGYLCQNAGSGLGVCYPGCETGSCPDAMVCDDGICIDACTTGSCTTENEICINGRCLVDVGDGPGNNSQFALDQLSTLCPDLPDLICTAGAETCNALEFFAPVLGPGYDNYPLNGETADNQYRSYLRHDAQMMIKYATAYVDCLAQGWVGNGGPLGLGDMSEADGNIPGTSIGQPGHPAGTHTDGHDIDLAYYQVGTANNELRPICDHYEGGQEAYHCVAPPHLLDPWRTALFLGAIMEHPNLRVVGCDGKAGPILVSALQQLCSDGWLSSTACGNIGRLTYEETDEGGGWFSFHHHHMHVSFGQPNYTHSILPQARNLCMIPNCDTDALYSFEQSEKQRLQNSKLACFADDRP